MQENKEFRDPALREALRRLYSTPPQLPADFADKFHEAAMQQYWRRRNVRRLVLWPSIAAAATVALLLTLHFTRQPVGESQMAQLPTSSVKDITAPIEKASPAPILSEASPKEGHKTCKRKNRVISQEEVTDNSIATASEEKTEEHNLAVASTDKQESIEMASSSDAKPNKEVEPALFNHNRYKVRSHIAAAFNMLQSTSDT